MMVDALPGAGLSVYLFGIIRNITWHAYCLIKRKPNRQSLRPDGPRFTNHKEKCAMQKNAMVVMFDSLHYGYLGCYGNDWIKTPNFDRFAEEGVLFENCYIEGLPTVPCRRAMHTGRYTLPFAGWVALSKDDTTIADLCWGRPIDTALVFDCPMYRLPKFGYTRGFDKCWFHHGHEADHDFYAQEPLLHEDPHDYVEDHLFRDADRIMGDKVTVPMMDELVCYLKQMQHWTREDDRYVAHTMKNAVTYLEHVDRTKQFFLWVDSFDPHEPWSPPSVYMDFPCPYDPDYKGKDQFLPLQGKVDGIYTEPELHHVRMLYAELVTQCDTWFGHLMEAVRRLGFEENTLIMFVSDHGEPMGNAEHGHGVMRKVRPWPYEELSHAPMMLKGPGIPAGKRVASFVQSVDVAPTVCDWLGIGVHPDMQGKSLLALAKGEVDSVRDYAVCGYNKYSWSLVTEDWSFIHWLKPDEDNATMMQNFFIKPVDEASAALKAVGGKGYCDILEEEKKERQEKGLDKPVLNDAQARYQEEASLDGAEQWTCTPTSESTVPDVDELYYRREDPFQLKNLIQEQPDQAKKMFMRLKDIMTDLRAS